MLAIDVGTARLGGGNPTIYALETEKATNTLIECAGRGRCDDSRGVCNCFSGYVSGDGMAQKGQRGDCGAQDQLFVSRQVYYLYDPIS